MLRSRISPSIKWTLLGIVLLSAVYLLAIWLAKTTLYQHRCVVIRCEPASWETIKDLAFEHARSNAHEGRISSIQVLPRTKFESEELDYINIYISYVSIEKDDNKHYEERTFSFNDHVLWVDDDARQPVFAQGLPDITFQERLAAAPNWAT